MRPDGCTLLAQMDLFLVVTFIEDVYHVTIKYMLMFTLQPTLIDLPRHDMRPVISQLLVMLSLRMRRSFIRFNIHLVSSALPHHPRIPDLMSVSSHHHLGATKIHRLSHSNID